ncbi:hypothetical protein AMTRI_Chr01g108400 [Amborella trichopoda]|uniref:Inhibitor I9 domain-containing protein n=1 Tax=Amborella trichopoda TaxID=13333 RepID=W1NY82_AMBTC|nr:subtilisin-like protease SBT2.5 [Amborella trichopoda]ERN00324.1 hypothetical protein AMTR_s00107p00154700 [Amborella trichopoda]|eukprot:XP_006837470.1 subtilisin-like protease SBT2.5 [Amborella trichopoda]
MGTENTNPFSCSELYFVFMDYDPQYELLRAIRSVQGEEELDSFLSKKHDMLLGRLFEPGSYQKRFSWAIVDGFAAELTSDQADKLRCADGVRVVEKNQELG